MEIIVLPGCRGSESLVEKAPPSGYPSPGCRRSWMCGAISLYWSDIYSIKSRERKRSSSLFLSLSLNPPLPPLRYTLSWISWNDLIHSSPNNSHNSYSFSLFFFFDLIQQSTQICEYSTVKLHYYLTGNENKDGNVQ